MKKLAIVAICLVLAVLVVGCSAKSGPEKRYLETLDHQLNYINDVLDRETEALRTGDVTLSFSQDRLVIEQKAWQQIYIEALQVQPPPRYGSLHESWLRALRLGDGWATERLFCLEQPLDSECLTQVGEKRSQLIAEIRTMGTIRDQLD